MESYLVEKDSYLFFFFFETSHLGSTIYALPKWETVLILETSSQLLTHYTVLRVVLEANVRLGWKHKLCDKRVTDNRLMEWPPPSLRLLAVSYENGLCCLRMFRLVVHVAHNFDVRKYTAAAYMSRIYSLKKCTPWLMPAQVVSWKQELNIFLN